jgi:hypothetical protein
VYVPSKLFPSVFVNVQVSEPCSSTESQAAMNNLIFKFLENGKFGLPDILQPMKGCPSLAFSNFDVPLSAFYPRTKVDEVLYVFNGFSLSTPKISRLIIQSQSHDFDFSDINEQPYVGCYLFYPM